MDKVRIMVVEDEAITAMYIEEVLTGLGYEVVASVASGREAIERAAAVEPQVTLMDIMLQGTMDGVEAAARIGEFSDTAVIYLTAAADVQILERAKLTEPFGYIIKPFEERDLHSNVEMALYKREMRRQLRESYAQEQEARRQSLQLAERLTSLLRSMGDGVIGLDREGRITFVNPALERITGWRAQELIGRSSHELFHHTRVDGSAYPLEECPIYASALRGGPIVHCEEEIFWRRDGGSFPVEYTTAAMDDGQGGTMGAVVVLRDISERKRIEAELRRHSDTLEQMVAERTAELESFSYSVSHDLRAPLRAINGFSQALWEDYGEQLDSTAHDYLGRIRNATRRMGELIDGLLTLSRVINADLSRQEVDLSRIATEIGAELSEAEPQRRVAFTAQSGLRVQGDPTLLRALLENLLKNAWKFTARRQDAAVEFGRTTVGAKEAFFVKDNGVGFDMKSAGTLFEPFRRLHPPEEFEGTGIGLATVYRIVKRHGGRVWAEGAPDLGAVIYFTLPQG